MKTISKIIISIVILTSMGLMSCEKHRIEGNHHETTEVRTLSGFDDVRASGSFEVDIHKDSISRVEIHAEENIIPYIETQLSGNVLHIGVKGNHNLRPNTSIHVDVYLPVLTAAHLSGSGSVSTDTFDVQTMEASVSGSGDFILRTHAQQLYVDISGSGNFDVAGSAKQADYTISGSGDIHGINMLVDTCYATISGSGNMYVNAIDLLDVHISGSGNIYYTGSPAMNLHISGSGQLISY